MNFYFLDAYLKNLNYSMQIPMFAMIFFNMSAN